MTIVPGLFKPRHGALSAHLFENPRVGVERNLYWSITFDFDPIEIEGEEEHPNCMAEWLIIPKPETALKSNLTLSRASQSHGEASCYLEHQHFPAEQWEFRLKPSPRDATWNLGFQVALDSELLEFTDQPTLELSGTTSIALGSLIIVKDNLTPKIKTTEQARQEMGRFFGAVENLECHDEGWRYVFRQPD